jgi:hypothetical protein
MSAAFTVGWKITGTIKLETQLSIISGVAIVYSLSRSAVSEILTGH